MTILVDNGADLTATNKQRNNVLHIASKTGNVAALAYTLETLDDDKRKTLIAATNEQGYTPLCMAAVGGHDQCASLLVHYGADVTSGMNAIMVAASWNAAKCLVALNKDKPCSVLYIQDKETGDTALHRAVRRGAVDAVQVRRSQKYRRTTLTSTKSSSNHLYTHTALWYSN